MTRRRVPRSRLKFCVECQRDTLPDETDPGRCEDCYRPTRASRDQFPYEVPDDDTL